MPTEVLYPTLSLDEALALGQTALECAEKRREMRPEDSGPIAVCVTLTTHDGSSPAPDVVLKGTGVKAPSVWIAIHKAASALAYRMDTRQFAVRQWGPSDILAARVALPTIVTWGGGVLLYVEGDVVGAIGISGLSEKGDHKVGVKAAKKHHLRRMVRSTEPFGAEL